MYAASSLLPDARVRATTVITVAKGGRVAMAGDGQVTMGDTVVKGEARKVRLLKGGRVLAGFAGAVADAFTLFAKLEDKLERWPSNLPRACVELAEALLAVADRYHLFLVGGDGNVIEPDKPVLAIGSGGAYALAAARALLDCSNMDATEIARRALEIAADICVYTNREITVLELDPA